MAGYPANLTGTSWLFVRRLTVTAKAVSDMLQWKGKSKKMNTCERNKTMTTLISKNIVVDGRRTSMRLEPEMWDALRDICLREDVTINQFCTIIDRGRGDTGLTAATRVFLIQYFRGAATGTGFPGSGRLHTVDEMLSPCPGARDVVPAAMPGHFPECGEPAEAHTAAAGAP